jgi:TRAP-type C4-dicarboxylate transport system permease small subunit
VQKADRFISKIVSWLNYLSSIVLLFMMIFVIVYIILRSAFGYSIFGTFEIVQLSCMTLVACALAGNDYREGNITVTVLVDMMPKTVKWIVELFALLLSSGLCIYCSFLMYGNMISRYEAEAVTANLNLPIWVFTLILFISFILLSVSVLFRTVKHIAGFSGKGPNKDPSKEELAANF